MDIRKFLLKNRMAAQIAYGIVLIVLIPLLITFNTVFIINKYNQSLDITLQRQALSIGRTISTLMENDLPWAEFVQIKIDTLLKNNITLQAIDVLAPEGDGFKIIAASDNERIGKKSDYYFYKLAWMQPNNDGLATDSPDEDGGGQFQTEPDSGRYWMVAMPMNGNDGKKAALLSVKISSKIVDDLTNYNRNISIYILIGTVMIVIMFLLVAVRLWDYALLYKKIKEVDKMKDEFISIASHELRTPVTGIRGFASMIIDGTMGKVSDKVLASVKMIHQASERLGTLVEDLLNVSRIEQNRMTIALESIDAGHVINEIISELKVQADAKKLYLEFKPNTLTLPIITVDPARFKEIMINLIGNAIKYTENGGVEILTREKIKSNTLEIIIKDTGIGMASTDRERLFEKFYRIQNDKTKNISGTGLGLWITKRLVELMNGKIIIDSMEGVGTQITLSFSITKG
ncbi:MAG: Two-component sensor histidine kinase [Candidatus Falkowbacteria bacterium GW2011_GWC2_38_22]|uniref:histidine kinase n=1 Tax=Candidatus Falkowbacteria bacterium GW2011_GWE1_38_31 TaxID=1618638 RepID=A0A0G0K477_9BACT|nr:MAG: Two-component sensor histidine kinase [Candidatus Falkowbacteria bacterium GW2011_GWF2_38_1205]KKQ60995.1 MAG: Two-component sensor histidine kinase [Candidatus Falkowbacteria bacterium GW2011_GWC2_38_22]KKQ63476.1 MAG: Two-component sensor histidine kinase [Candidatus Falkowbacteria bacterium GW2011_GWF1_38_22]KKQ65453.1 MAG: Two-component sensor histidine kinase [Candidatus Falkowbacteria bacterium GW2011_GWE2_38_254]KKQ70240.1 MAG: Two-component sensor histidine kinase [Candidatus Fa